MGVCFIGERGRFGDFICTSPPGVPAIRFGAASLNVAGFPAQYASTAEGKASGDVVSPDGRILGRHRGLWHYTIGQRARLGGMGEALYVAKKSVDRNEIVVVPGR